MKPTLPPIDVPGSTPFQKMDNLFRKVVTVSKDEIDRREKQWQKQNRSNRRPQEIDLNAIQKAEACVLQGPPEKDTTRHDPRAITKHQKCPHRADR